MGAVAEADAVVVVSTSVDIVVVTKSWIVTVTIFVAIMSMTVVVGLVMAVEVTVMYGRVALPAEAELEWAGFECVALEWVALDGLSLDAVDAEAAEFETADAADGLNVYMPLPVALARTIGGDVVKAVLAVKVGTAVDIGSWIEIVWTTGVSALISSAATSTSAQLV